MPKKRSKNGKGKEDAEVASLSGGRRSKVGKGNTGSPLDRDRSPENLSDLSSEVSHLSLDDDLESVLGNGASRGGLEDEEISENSEEVIERKLAESLENATHKNPGIRLAALKIVQNALSRCYVPEILEKWRVTLADVIERSLKRAGTEESEVAARLAALLAVQLGTDSSDLMGRLNSLLKVYSADPTMDPNFRAHASIIMSLCLLLTEEEPEVITEGVRLLHTVWSGIKHGGVVSADSANLFSASVQGWALLLPQMSPRKLQEILATDLPKLCTYLECSHVEVRIAAGEVLALLYELGDEIGGGEIFHPANHHQTLEILLALSTDSAKYRAKRDKRMQRSSFRQIYGAIKNQEEPDVKVKFDMETLELERWADKLTYDSLCQVLRGGMNFHLRQNLFMRDIFNLGAPIQDKLSRSDRQTDKSEKQAMHATMAKARQLNRGRQRGKRVATFES